MAEAPAAATGTSSTPPAEGSPPAAVAPAAPKSDASPTATPTSEGKPAASAATPVAPDGTKEGAPPADVKTAPADKPAEDKPAPLFTLPEDMKLSSESVSKFETFLKGKTVDGKLTLTNQEVVDQFAAQARDAYVLWQKQQVDMDKANETLCKERFTPAQLSASETAIGFFTSFEPAFRDLAKRQLNDPVFVNAMRIIGERLSEDTFEIPGNAPIVNAKGKSAAERMGYTKPKTN
jgi:hypothetical protein